MRSNSQPFSNFITGSLHLFGPEKPGPPPHSVFFDGPSLSRIAVDSLCFKSGEAALYKIAVSDFIKNMLRMNIYFVK
jgi:hypothetical protein